MKITNIMISIVIPLYNKEVYIRKTIENVLEQTYKNFELIIVDDGSTDNSVEIVNSFNDNRICLVKKENGGVSSARNVGIKQAKYEYIAFLDADDTWLPTHVEELVNLINDFGNVSDVFATNFARKYDDGRIVPNRKESDLQRGIINNYFEIIRKEIIIHTSSVCIKKEKLLQVGGFDERLSRGEDLDLWFKVCKDSFVAYNPKVTSLYLQDAVNNSNKKTDIDKSFAYYLNFDCELSISQRKYLKNILYRKYLILLIKDKDFQNFIKLFKKQGL